MSSKTLVIAVDTSKESLKALDIAISHFPTGQSVILITSFMYTLVPSVLPSSKSSRIWTWWSREWSMPHTSSWRTSFAEKAKSAGAEAYAVVVETDSNSTISAGPALCDYAWKVKADALILMRRNKSAVSRFFMGSVTRYCAVHSPVPVLIVPSAP
ncbi:g9436 [Coccomyxa elongata]